MAWIASLGAWRKQIYQHVGIGATESSSSSGSKTLLQNLDESDSPRQISQSIYEIRNMRPEQRSAEIVCFHGLEIENSDEPQITTWLSKDKKELWLNWVQTDFPNVRILTVRYDASLVKTNDQGRFDTYQICENLLGELTRETLDGGHVGKAECPIILVGHCVGGVVLKALLVMAANRFHSEQESAPMKHFLLNVKGILCYASPDNGSELPSPSIWYPKGSLFKDLGLLDTETARRNFEFQRQRRKFKWRSIAIGEVRPVILSQFTGLIVTEASSRNDVDDYCTVNDDHFDVCRPESRQSRKFTKLADLIDAVIKEDEGLMPVLSNLPKNTVGLESRRLAIREKLRTEARIAIVGMGGIGKTTLALAVYEEIAKEFQYSCFFREVRVSMGIRTTQDLRKKITEKLVDRKGRSVGESFQWNELKGKSVLIVLDDVNSEEQVQVMTETDEFLWQSRVIITARGKGFIAETTLGFHIHELEKLDDELSKELLCLCAFQEKEPPTNLRMHVKHIVGVCGGLPLALTVTGKYLSRYPQDDTVWEETRGRLLDGMVLSGNKADDRLWSILRLSYESLESHEQEIFLDVATCFHGEPMEEVQKVWTVCRKFWKTSWKNLLDLHLVRQEEAWGDYSLRTCVYVHEVLRGLGRRLAGYSRMSAYNLQKLSKLRDGDAESVKVVRGLPELFPNKLAKLTKLEILWLDYHEDKEQRDHESDDEGSHQSDHDDDSVDHSESDREDDGESSHETDSDTDNESHDERDDNESNSQDNNQDNHGSDHANNHVSNMDNSFDGSVFTELTFVRAIHVTSNNQVKAIFGLKSLQYLILEMDVEKISRTLWAGIRNLQQLQYLEMAERSGEVLPQVYHHQEIQHFTMMSNVNTKQVSKLGKLKSLTIDRFFYLTAIPRGMGKLRRLQSLKLSGCSSLKTIPEGISKLQELKFLTISGCWMLEAIPKAIVKLKRLQSLTISDCNDLKTIPEGVSQLQELKLLAVTDCRSLEVIPRGINKLQRLQSLTISGCSNLEAIPVELGRLVNLKALDIFCHNWMGVSPREIGQLKLLESLRLSICDSLEVTLATTDQLQDPLKLSQFLDRSWCVELMAIVAEVGKLRRLESIDICHYIKLSAIGKTEDEELESPYTLDISWDDYLQGIPAELIQFWNPKVSVSYQLELVNIIASHFKVVQMTLSEDWYFKGSKELTIKSCGDFVIIPSFGSDLRSITISGCHNLKAIPSQIFLLRSLKHLTVSGCHKLKAIPSETGELLGLESLTVSECSSLEVIHFEQRFSCIGSLHISRCNELKAIPFEILCHGSLQSLNISGCPKLVIPEEILEKMQLVHTSMGRSIITRERSISMEPSQSREENDILQLMSYLLEV